QQEAKSTSIPDQTTTISTPKAAIQFQQQQILDSKLHIQITNSEVQSQSHIRSLEYNNPEIRSHNRSPVTAIQIQRFLPDAEIGEVDRNAPNTSMEAALGMTKTEAVYRPPPEPPDLTLLAEGKGELTSTVVLAAATSHRSEKVRDAATGLDSGAEHGAVAKGKMEADHHMALNEAGHPKSGETTDQSYGGSDGDVAGGASPNAESGAFAKGKRMAAIMEDGATTVEDETATITIGLRARRLRRFVSLTLPPLLVAVLPWTRNGEREEWSRGCWQWGEGMVSGRSSYVPAAEMASKRCHSSFWMNQWLAQGRWRLPLEMLR
ncbi:hypothetical protein PIB30_022573, partial [Stylosanthes scabra]|nr:hypothetical protein [Stylosanthes scabra]